MSLPRDFPLPPMNIILKFSIHEIIWDGYIKININSSFFGIIFHLSDILIKGVPKGLNFVPAGPNSPEKPFLFDIV
jgi:hypothetical protein